MREQTESQIQSAFFEWLSLHEKKYPELSLCYAIPNGAHKSIASRMKFKREGLKAGVPDVHLPIAAGIDIGLWIEFKAPKGKLSDVQIDWLYHLMARGHQTHTCRSWEAAANIVIDYLNLPIEKLTEPPLTNGRPRSTR
jgi:hypothetical protein